jgi:hypothetical protein
VTAAGRGEGLPIWPPSFRRRRIRGLDVRAPYDPLRRFGGSAIASVQGPCRRCPRLAAGQAGWPSRPAAAEASDRNRSLSRPHPGASEAKGDSHDHRQLTLRQGPGTPTRASSRPSRLRPAGLCSSRTRRRATRAPATASSVRARPAMSSSAPRGRSAARKAGITLSVKLDDPALTQAVNCAGGVQRSRGFHPRVVARQPQGEGRVSPAGAAPQELPQSP